ncbi:MAG: hypothetical protein AAF666_15665 [Pseudomonadota bacterium]
MDRFLWLTGLATSEPVGLPPGRIVLIEQRTPADGHAVVLHLDTGHEIEVMESLSAIRDLLTRMPSSGIIPLPTAEPTPGIRG